MLLFVYTEKKSFFSTLYKFKMIMEFSAIHWRNEKQAISLNWIFALGLIMIRFSLFFKGVQWLI